MLKNKAQSRTLPLLVKLTLENRKLPGILMEVIRTLFSPKELIFCLSHRPGNGPSSSAQAQLLHWTAQPFIKPGVHLVFKQGKRGHSEHEA